MKRLSSLFLAILLASCTSSGSTETTTQDSTALNDTLDVPALPDQGETEPTANQVSDTSQLEITFDETAGLVFESMEMFYTVTIATKQYEASADVTWYFNADFDPIYFKESSASEGTEGSVEFFIRNGEVQCASVIESYGEGGSTEKWCSTTGGTIIRFDAGIKELLPADFGKNYNTTLSRDLDILKAILKEAEVTQEDENSYTLRIEKTVDVGMEVQESTEVSIPKKVYKSIMGE